MSEIVKTNINPYMDITNERTEWQSISDRLKSGDKINMYENIIEADGSYHLCDLASIILKGIQTRLDLKYLFVKYRNRVVTIDSLVQESKRYIREFAFDSDDWNLFCLTYTNKIDNKSSEQLQILTPYDFVRYIRETNPNNYKIHTPPKEPESTIVQLTNNQGDKWSLVIERVKRLCKQNFDIVWLVGGEYGIRISKLNKYNIKFDRLNISDVEFDDILSHVALHIRLSETTTDGVRSWIEDEQKFYDVVLGQNIKPKV
jgi:hypothetical protein